MKNENVQYAASQEKNKNNTKRMQMKLAVEKAIELYSNSLQKKGAKVTASDLVRIVQLEKEIGSQHDEVKEIRVTWVDPLETESVRAR